LSDTVKVKR